MSGYDDRDDPALNKEDSRAYDLGYAAYSAHGNIEDNPYAYGCPSWYAWKRGFEDASVE